MLNACWWWWWLERSNTTICHLSCQQWSLLPDWIEMIRQIIRCGQKRRLMLKREKKRLRWRVSLNFFLFRSETNSSVFSFLSHSLYVALFPLSLSLFGSASVSHSRVGPVFFIRQLFFVFSITSIDIDLPGFSASRITNTSICLAQSVIICSACVDQSTY